MENREYFFHKRKSMAGFPPNESDTEDRGQQNSYRGNRGHRGSYRGGKPGGRGGFEGNRGGYSHHAKWASRKEQAPQNSLNKNFFDTMGTSCNLDDKDQKPTMKEDRGYERRHSETYDRKVHFQGGRGRGGHHHQGEGGRGGQRHGDRYGGDNWKPSHYQQTQPHRKYTE